MPLLLILLGSAVALPLLGVAVDNVTAPKPSVPSAGGIQNGMPDIIKYPLIIAGTILAIKYGSKLIKKS